MGCPYYWWNYHYACRKSGKDVNEDTYDRYCKDYSYGDCPIYKGNDSSGCFLTSACVEAKDLPDNCYELSTLRRFRDGYLMQQEGGECEINHYYHVAPLIVERIKEKKDAKQIFEKLYEDLVLPCVKEIEHGEYCMAHEIYRSYVLALEQEHLGDCFV